MQINAGFTTTPRYPETKRSFIEWFKYLRIKRLCEIKPKRYITMVDDDGNTHYAEYNEEGERAAMKAINEIEEYRRKEIFDKYCNEHKIIERPVA